MSIEKKRMEAKEQFIEGTGEAIIFDGTNEISSQSVQEIDWKKKYELGQKIMEASTAKLISVQQQLTGSEAVFGFCGWLTCREAQTIMSSKDDAAIIANLVKEFCSVNRLDDPRDGWEDNLEHPKAFD